MKNYLRCKACGYVLLENKLKDVCPACGVKKEMFIPDTEKLSEKRRQILDSHIHPIVVHFPQAFTVTIFLLLLSLLTVPNQSQKLTSSCAQLLIYFLPFVGIASFISGIFDGKIRFRKLKAPLLKQKMTLGILFLIFSCISFTLVLVNSLEKTVLLNTGIAAIEFICTALLGKIGAGLAQAKFPG